MRIQRNLSCDEIRNLVDAAIDSLEKKHGIHFRDRQIFNAVFGERYEPHVIHGLFLRYLHDVSLCPPRVIKWCQKEINTRD